MDYQIFYPCPRLSQFIKSYWIYKKTDKSQISLYVHPTGEPQIIFYLSERDEKNSILVSGQSLQYGQIEPQDASTIIGVVFYPHGLKAFIKAPLCELTNNSVEAAALDKSFSDLEKKLVDFPDNRERINKIEDNLLILLVNNEIDNYRVSEYLSNQIVSNKGRLSMEYLYGKTGFSKRHLERIFKNHIGISPKKLSTIIQVNYAVSLFSEERNLTDIAYEAGFFDQPHFIRTFKTCTGYSPKKYRDLMT